MRHGLTDKSHGLIFMRQGLAHRANNYPKKSEATSRPYERIFRSKVSTWVLMAERQTIRCQGAKSLANELLRLSP